MSWRPLPPRNPKSQSLGDLAVRQPKVDWAFKPTAPYNPANRPPKVASPEQWGSDNPSPDKRDRLHVWTPKVESPGYPVAGSQGCTLSCANNEHASKKMWKPWKPGDSLKGSIVTDDGTRLVPVLVTITLPDGNTKEIQPRLRTNTLTVTAYGKSFELRRCNRGHSVYDGRTGKRITREYAFAELCRILGNDAGESAFRQLCSV